MLVIAFSYRQTIHRLPGRGRGLQGRRARTSASSPGLVAAAALLLDYVLTVAVSIAAGVAAVTSAFPEWHDQHGRAVARFLVVLTIGNLRGIRESGRIFSVPTYFFLGSMGGAARSSGRTRRSPGRSSPIEAAAALDAGGDGAAHGLPRASRLRERVHGADGDRGDLERRARVQAAGGQERRDHAPRHDRVRGDAASWASRSSPHAYHVVPRHEETVISQLNRAILGGRGPFYYMVQAATTMILVLAANTAFSDFPRLASIIARDDSCRASSPIRATGWRSRTASSCSRCLAGVLLVAFGGDTHALIPLYMLGVFVSFTLSQAGMVLKWRRERKTRLAHRGARQRPRRRR